MFILGYLENQWHSVNFIENFQALKASWACCLGENVFEMLLHTWWNEWILIPTHIHRIQTFYINMYERRMIKQPGPKNDADGWKSVFASPWNINELFQKRKKAASGYFVCFRILFKWIFHFGKKPLNLSKIHRHDSQCQHWKYSKNIFNAAILRASWEKRSIWDDTFFDSAFSSLCAFSSLSLDTEKT